MFRNKEYIYCVYQERNFSKAAEKLHLAQPSLSATVRKVEEQLGAPIFDRKTRPISLTPFGVEYIRSIEQVNELEGHLRELVNELHTLQSGTLAIGGSNLNIPYKIPRKIAEFQRSYPRVSLRVVEASTVRCKHLLDAGELDLICTNRPLSEEEYERIVCYRETLLLAVPAEFALNRELQDYRLTAEELGDACFSVPDARCIPLRCIRDTPMVLLHDGNYLRWCCEEMFRENDFTPIVALEVEKSSVAYNYANFGIGATIISNVLAEHLAKMSELVFYRIRGEHAVRNGYLYYKRGRFVTSAMKRFIEMMLQ